MSLHAQMTPEAREALERQRRNSKAASIVLGLLGTTLIALLLGILLLPVYSPPPSGTTVIHIPEDRGDDPPPPRMRPVSQNPSSPSARPVPVITVPVPDLVSLPTVQVPVTESDSIGSGNDWGEGAGFEDGPGMNGRSIPCNTRKRCSKEDRLQMLAEGGGTPEVEESVVRALRYLKSTQAADGSWGSKHKTAMTGLALLAYIGHCETSLSEEFGDSCLGAITYLVDIGMKNQGRLVHDITDRHWPYEQAIATYALAEAQTFHAALDIEIPMLRDTVSKAGQLIIDSQHPSGGWDYAYDESGNRGGDLSITGWHIQALKACKLTGIDFRNLKNCVKRSLEYVEARQASDGGFCYTGSSPVTKPGGAALTGVGMLSLQMWGKGSAPAVRKGAKYAEAKLRFDWATPDCDLYAHYYLSQAMFQRGDKTWNDYQTEVLADLPSLQKADGSWPVPGGGGKTNAVGALFANDSAEGRHYRTVLTTLMLEVYYRYLPATQ